MVVFYIAFIVIVDQVSKYIIQSKVDLHESIQVIPKIFHITYVQNYGAAFGILKHRTGFFVTVSIILVTAILIYLLKMPNDRKLLKSALVLVVGGAAGNMIDRVRLGFVVDFFDLRVWPVFNIADMAIVTGIGLLIFQILRAPERF
jgi:signal peptidase II